MTPLRAVLARCLRGLPTAVPDRDLLRAAAADGDADAFRALVERHGPMVLRLCRRWLGDRHAAEDAFQATFLILARKAGALRRPDALAAWLFGVARRVASKARAADARRRQREARVVPRPPPDPLDELTARELFDALDEELARLPERYRLPLLLVYWQGLTQDEAARRLGWTPGSVKGRLERGRSRLADRLTRRGFAPSALLAAPLAAAAVPADLLARTAALAADPWSGSLPAAVLALAATAAPAKLLPAVALGILFVSAGLLASAWQAGSVSDRSVEAQPPVAEAAGSPSNAQANAPRVDRFGDALPTGARLRLGTVRFRHNTNWLKAAAPTPDGRGVVVASGDSVYLWDIATGREHFNAHGFVRGNTVLALAVSPDGTTAVSATSRIPGAANKVEVPITLFPRMTSRKHMTGPGTDVGHMAFLSDGTLATAGSDQTVRAWDTTTGQELRRYPWPGGRFSALAAAPDGTLVAAAGLEKGDDLSKSPNGAWTVWNAATGDVVLRDTALPSGRLALAFAPDNRTLALVVGLGEPFTDTDGATEIRLWDVAERKELRRWRGHTGKYSHLVSAAFAPDGKTLATGGADHVVRTWAVATGAKAGPDITPHRFAGKVAFTRAGELMTWGSQNTVRFWDPATGRPLHQFEGHEAHLTTAAWSSDGRFIATGGGGGDASVRIWDAATGAPRLTLRGPMLDITAVAFRPDNRLAASADSSGAVRLWDLTTGKELRALTDHTRWVQSIAFAPDGRTLASGDDGHTVRLWDVDSGQQLRTLTGHIAEVRALVFAPDGRTLYTTGDRSVRAWDVATGQSLWARAGTPPPNGGNAPDGHTAAVTCLALSADGRRLVSGSYDHSVRIWEAATGRVCRCLPPPDRSRNRDVPAVALSADGALLAIAGAEDGLRECIDVWNLRTNERTVLDRHLGFVKGLAFAPDGRSLASVSADTTGLVWDLSARRDRPARALTEAERQSLWAELNDGDATKAYDAVNRAATAPADAVAALRPHLKPLAAVPAERVVPLIADLDSPVFARREQAAKELAKLGPGAAAPLRAALEKQPTLELRQRIEALLAAWDDDWRRSDRALEILEAVATPEARTLLEELARGDPAARLTREAQASLERLRRR